MFYYCIAIIVVDIPSTTQDVCNMLKSSIISLLRAYKDPSIDAAAIRIFPGKTVTTEESDDSDDDFFSRLCYTQIKQQ